MLLAVFLITPFFPSPHLSGVETLPFLRSHTKHWLRTETNTHTLSQPKQLNNKKINLDEREKQFSDLSVLPVRRSLKHGSSVDVITVSVWWWLPPVCVAWTYSTGDNSAAMKGQINCLTPAVHHFIPPACLLQETQRKTLSEHVLSSPPCAPLDLLCPFILPLKQPVVPLVVGGKWNKDLLLTSAPIWEFIAATKTQIQSSHWPPRSVYGETHHASVMAVILFSEAILDALEAAWKPPLTLPERLHLIPPCKMRLLSLLHTAIPCSHTQVFTYSWSSSAHMQSALDNLEAIALLFLISIPHHVDKASDMEEVEVRVFHMRRWK